MTSDLISLDNAVFRTFAFYAAILLFKTISMSMLTSTYRILRENYWMPEDYARFSKKPHTGRQSDPDIERLVRIHANDIENILPFILIGILYILTGPSIVVATWYFRIYACSRLVHTFVYFFAIQPARVLVFSVGWTVNALMVITVILHLL